MDKPAPNTGKESSGAKEKIPVLVMRGVHKSFHNGSARIEILKGADLVLNQGETLAVVGPSGIGKSTMLHILGTLERPDEGKLIFEDKDVFEFDDDALARFRNQSIGFVFQFHHLLPEFSALENVMMPALIQGMPNEQARDEARKGLGRVGLSGRLEHKISEMSGGSSSASRWPGP